MPKIKNYQSINSFNIQKDHLLFAKCLVEIDLKSFIKKTKGSIPGDELPELPTGHRFLCPISHEIMLNPTTTQNGFTFDFENIKKWLEISKTNPLTRQSLIEGQLVCHEKLKKEIESWKKRGDH